MCDKRSSVRLKLPTGKVIRVDKCLIPDIIGLWEASFETLSSCCGHGRYPKTIIVKNVVCGVEDAFTGIKIPRTKRFYKTDSEGFYYIPEVKKQ